MSRQDSNAENQDEYDRQYVKTILALTRQTEEECWMEPEEDATSVATASSNHLDSLAQEDAFQKAHRQNAVEGKHFGSDRSVSMPSTFPGAVAVSPQGNGTLSEDIHTITYSTGNEERNSVTAITRADMEQEIRTDILEAAVQVSQVQALPEHNELEEKDTYTDRSKRKRMIVCVTTFVVLLTVGLIVGLVIGMASSRESTDPESSSQGLTTLPTSTPTSAPLTIQREELQDFLLEKSPDPAALLDSTSPAFAAMEWLLSSESNLRQGINDDGDAILQSFAMATIFEALNGRGWTTSGPKTWLTPLLTCQWLGVSCDDETESNVVELDIDAGINARGTLPLEIGLLTHLQGIVMPRVNLGTSNRTDYPQSLPTTLGMLSNTLESLRLGGCNLQGTLPSEMGLLSQLTLLRVFGSNLQGEIPKEWKGMISMQNLDVSNNNLEGFLPVELDQMTNLERFIVLGNNFEGPVPSSYASNWPGIQYVRLQDNPGLNGTLDGSFCKDSRFVPPLMNAIEADCDSLDCPCCVNC